MDKKISKIKTIILKFIPHRKTLKNFAIFIPDIQIITFDLKKYSKLLHKKSKNISKHLFFCFLNCLNAS